MAAGVVPALVVVVQAFVSQPLATGLGLPAGWTLVNEPMLIASIVWLLFCLVGIVVLSRVPGDASRSTVARRSMGAFGLVTVSSWLPVTVFMRLSAYMGGYNQPNPARAAFALAVELMTFLGLIALVALAAMAIWRTLPGKDV